ncbi:MAG: fibronectin type III domain-containing protein [Patescibacteria group bacterium]
MTVISKKGTRAALFVSFVLACFLSHASLSQAATYYVDSVGGSDGNAGTSTGAPWQTLSKIASSTFSGGDSVLLKAGDVWRESLIFPSSGTSGNPITIGKYGSGANPVLNGSDILPNANFTVYDAPNNTYQIPMTVEGNGVAAVWENGARLTLAVSLAAATSTPGSVFYNTTTHIMYVHSANASPNVITNGLTYEGTKRGNVAYDNGNSWLIWQDLEIDKGFTNLSAHLVAGNNNIVRRVNYYENANHHLGFYGSNNLGEDLYGENDAGGSFLFYGPSSHDNIFRRIQSVANIATLGPAVQAHGGSYNNIVEDSLLTSSVTPSSQTAAIGLSADAGTSIIARRNKIMGKWTFAFGMNSGAGINSEFYDNVIDGSQFITRAISLTSTGATGLKIYNNTYYTSGTQDFFGVDASGSAEVRNNIVYVSSSGFYVFIGSASSTVFSNNEYFGSSRTNAFGAVSGNKTFLQWQALGYDTNSQLANPLFVSSTSPSIDLSLQPGSPAIDVGTNFGSPYNLALSASTTWPSNIVTLNQNSYGAGWERGAYVYGGASALSVAMASPSSGATVASTTTISATATASSPATISSVQFYLDGSTLGAPVTSTTSPNTYSYAWNTTAATDGAHTLYAVATNDSANATTSPSISVTVDNTAPVISAIASSTTQTGATITWTTNESSDSRVDFGLTSSYGTASSSVATSTSHSITLSGLTASTLYHFRVQSTDATSHAATSSDLTFTTAAVPDTTPPIISSIASSTTQTGATVTWTTNEGSDSRVDYGTSSSYGTASTSAALLTSHSITLSGLTASTLYHFRVQSTDASSNVATSSDLTFTTTAVPDTTPPVISSIASSTSQTSATISWTTNEAANSQVDYGTTASYGTASTSAAFSTSHSLTLTGLTASTLYHFRVQSVDASSNVATSSDLTFTTTAVPDTTAPLISGISSSTGQTSAVITWTTDESSDSRVDFGGSSSYGTASTSAALTTSHSLTLTGLTASTTYHFRVQSADVANNIATSSDKTFTTAAVPDTTPPVISAIASSTTQTGATISWTTNEASDSRVDYGLTSSYGTASTSAALGTSHSISLSGLTPSTTYHFRIRSTDASSNTATSSAATFTTATTPDTTAPVISAIAASADSSTATITWSTDEAATSQVEYGTSTSYSASSTLDASLVTSHSVTLTDLASGITYHYRVLSSDASANLATSSDQTFDTESASSGSSHHSSHSNHESSDTPSSPGDSTTTTTTTTSTSTTTAPTVSFIRDLTLGATGDDVRALQEFLLAHGFSIPAGATGYFGLQTKAALAAFQAASGIVPSVGYFGPLTRAFIAAGTVSLPVTNPTGTAVTPATPLPTSVSGFVFTRPLFLGDTGADVIALQTILQAKGFYTYPVITGYYGQVTLQAVADFQRSVGLDHLGYVGPATRGVLNTLTH